MDIAVSNTVVSINPKNGALFSIASFHANSGESVLIKGASGKGKTTFLHLLAGLFCPEEGTVHIGESCISRLDEETRCLFRRQNIGIVFQKLNLIEHLTPLENIELSVRGNHSKEKALESLKAVGLNGRESEKVSVLSLGEQQRVAIARVLAGNFGVVLADEPTSSLDEHNAIKVTELLLKASMGKTLIVVSHDHRIEKYFSRIIDFEELIKQ